MILNKKILIFLVLLSTFVIDCECKRSGGRSRGSSSRGSSLWNRNNKKSSSGTPQQKPQEKSQSHYDLASLSYPNYNKPKPVQKTDPVKTTQIEKQKTLPSAPKQETPIQKPVPSAPKQESPVVSATNPLSSAPKYEPQNLQQSSFGNDNLNKRHIQPVNQQNTQQRPVGWDVGQQQTKTVQHQQYSAPNQNGYPSQNNLGYQSQNNFAYPNTGGYNYPNSGGNNPYPSHSGAYPNTGSYNYYGGGQNYNYGNGYNPQQPFQGYHPTSNIGVIPPNGANAGHYYNSVAGLGNQPTFMNHGNSGGNGGGIFSRLFGGGNKYGNNGYGGYGGGYGGYGGYGYGGMSKPKGFGLGFGGNAYRNVLAGLLIWNLFRGGSSHKYNVYNYYNRPENATQNISLPANVITLCPENATMLCAPNTTPLCTAEETILCVATVAATIPCQGNISGPCINSTDPCPDSDPNCKNSTTETNSLPCIANATVLGNVKLLEGNSTTVNATLNLFNQANNKTETVFCVTTMAMPYVETVEESGLVACGNSGCNSVNNVTEIGKVENSTALPNSVNFTGNVESTTVRFMMK